MPNLSARFSMLREQDDPTSMLGKASDDSVLHAHRKSKLGGFGDTGLSDIAEVASIHSIRPPFASGARSASYHTDASIITDDDSTTSGSIMSRSRPGEGNVLFGGRQKIYKIPVGDAGSVKNLGSNEPRGMKGRALYEDDVHMSAFQKYREQERQAERERRLAELEREMQNDDGNINLVNSPSLSTYDEKRETTSSTNSGPSRSSTAATSIMSHAPASGSAAQSPGVTTPHSAGPGTLQRSSSRRLYDSNLDHHMTEQQSAALTRMNSMQRKASSSGRSTPHQLTQSRSATNLRERFGPPASTESSRAASPLPPPPSEKLTTFESVRSPLQHSPKSPNFNESDNPLAQAVDKADRGKATALGQFNKPKQFDEQQFLQRQRSLHQQRSDSRSPRPPIGRVGNDGRRPSAEARAYFPPRRPSEEARSRAGSAQSDRRMDFVPRPRAPTLRSDKDVVLAENRPSIDHNRPDESRPSFSGRHGPEVKNDIPPRVPFRQPLSTTQSPLSGSPTKPGRQEYNAHSVRTEQIQPPAVSKQQQTAFYDSPVSPKTVQDESPLLGTEQHDDEPGSPKVSLERGRVEDIPAPLRSPPQLRDHPAMRNQPSASPSKEDRRNMPAQQPFAEGRGIPMAHSGARPTDVQPAGSQHDLTSPSGNQLNGLIRSHLRQPSNVSSIYPLDDDRARQSQMYEENHRVSSILDPHMNGFAGVTDQSVQPDGFPPENFDPNNIGVAMSSPSEHHDNSMDLPPGPRPGDAEDWMRELHQQHTRDASTETQHERRVFAEDLQLRQKAIQENLRIKTENVQRAPSPGGNVASRTNMFEKPFGMLRKSSSRENVHQRKMGLGISAGPPLPTNNIRNGPPPPPRAAKEPVGRTLHMRMPDHRPSEDTMSSRSNSRPRKTSQASEMASSSNRTPPDSSRTSTSNDGASRRERSDSSADIRRSEFPSSFNSAHPSARPSLESGRQRSDSSAASRHPPPVPPLRTNNVNLIRPPMTSLGPSSTSQTSTTSVSPIQSTANTPPLSATSLSSPDLRGQTNTSLSQIPPGVTPPIGPQTLPASTYAFPPRSDKDRPAARRPGRSPTINKGDISQPTLISSTSSFETMELDRKRAQLQAMSLGNFGTQSPVSINSATSPPPIPAMSPNRRIFGRSPTESGRVSPAVNGSGTTSPPPGAVRQGNDEDDYMTRPPGGRLRIRKVSSEGGGLNKRRHEAVRAGLVEKEEPTIAGGMF